MSLSNTTLTGMDNINEIICKLCVDEELRRQARTITRMLIDLVTYTYTSNLRKINDDVLAACYTLYSIYTINMLRDVLYTVIALRDILHVWKDMFLIVSGAISLHIASLGDNIKFETRPTKKTAHISLREVNEVAQLYENMLVKICERELIPYSRLTLRLSSQIFAISTIVLLLYLCSPEVTDKDQVSEHIRRVVEYAINEESRKALSEYYEIYMTATG